PEAPADTPTPPDSPTPAPPTATPTPTPIMPTPTVTDRLILAVTDADGRYTMDNVPVSATLTLKEPGYALTKVPVGAVITQDVALQPFQVKALYVTAPAVVYHPLIDHIL